MKFYVNENVGRQFQANLKIFFAFSKPGVFKSLAPKQIDLIKSKTASWSWNQVLLPVMTWDLGLHGLIPKTIPFSRRSRQVGSTEDMFYPESTRIFS